MIIVSACLAGINCAYDGKHRQCEAVVKLVAEGKAIPLCPEQLGGLPTPRIPSEIQDNNQVITEEGINVTKPFQQGVQEAMRVVTLVNPDEAILKSKSPSCGRGEIYDGTFTHTLINGNGLFAEELIDTGISIKTEKEL